jgi:Tyrosine phosphatase family
VKKGWTPAGRKELVKDVKNAGATFGAETVGVAELVGLRYPVSKYEFKVSAGLTRGSRIEDPKGYQSLVKQGFKGIVDLTLEGTNDAKGGKAAGLNTCNVKILDNSAPTQAQMKQFLDFATNPKNSPCYVHCEAGKGRTGVAVASYRMAVEGWPPAKAIAEAKKFGCSLPDQIDFLNQFGADLAKGKLQGYPKK